MMASSIQENLKTFKLGRIKEVKRSVGQLLKTNHRMKVLVRGLVFRGVEALVGTSIGQNMMSYGTVKHQASLEGK